MKNLGFEPLRRDASLRYYSVQHDIQHFSNTLSTMTTHLGSDRCNFNGLNGEGRAKRVSHNPF
jgi:hypothetical protein